MKITVSYLLVLQIFIILFCCSSATHHADHRHKNNDNNVPAATRKLMIMQAGSVTNTTFERSSSEKGARSGRWRSGKKQGKKAVEQSLRTAPPSVPNPTQN
nr:transmembrane protein, putative [Ipomoea batatas]